MNKIIHVNIDNVSKEHKNNHKDYECYVSKLVPSGYGKQCVVYMYEILPLKSMCPYHYHTKNEESFLILSGEGIIKTPDGEKKVSKGDFLFFPANQNGAHKITNSSKTDNLVYIDFDTTNDLELTKYPNSKKIGIWDKGTHKIFREEDSVDYYEGE